MGLISKSEVSTEIISKISSSFDQINEEREEFLQAINENTSEIQEVYAYAANMDNKISKLQEQIEELKLMFTQMSGKKIHKIPSFEDIDPLNTMEKNVFLNVYTEEKPISYIDLARKLNMSVTLTRQYVLNLMEKGIPIQKTYSNTRPLLMLDRRFRNLQAKKNILKIEQKILV